MGYIEDIASTLRQAGIDPKVSAGSAVRRGWDYCVPGERFTDGDGAARLPHPFFAAPLPEGALWIVHPTMSALALTVGIWRQCLIRPGDDRANNSSDPSGVSSLAARCARDEYLIALTGHTPRDLALWLANLRGRDRAAFELVVAKNFRAALAFRPEIILDGWPAGVIARWCDIARDYLPPFLVAVLYGELARLANNQAGLLELPFDAETELTTTRFLERVPLAAHGCVPAAVTRAIDMLPLQSVALTPPDSILCNLDRQAGADWARTAAASISLMLGETGGLSLAPSKTGQAAAFRDNYAASPSFWLEQRDGHGSSRQPRPAATLWGLNRRRHAAVGLLEIATQAQRWNRQYRPGGANLAALPRRRRAQAILAISTSWLAEIAPAAALAELNKVSAGGSADLTAASVSPLAIDAMLTDKSGDGLLKLAEERIGRRPRPGELGYTARYLAHLWLDNAGDDLPHYLNFQAQAQQEHGKAMSGIIPTSLQDTARVDPKYVALLGRQHGVAPKHGGVGHNKPPPSMTADPNAARAAQQLGQMVSSLSTSSILEVLLGRK